MFRSSVQWSQKTVPITSVTSGPASHFCGFHDIVPWSPSDRLMLGLEADESDRLPEPGDKVRIGVIDLTTPRSRFTSIAESSCWNWHLGARQQWLDDERIIYNDTRNGHHIAVIHDLASGCETEIGHAVWSVSPDGRWAIAPNFARLRRYYEVYGYPGGAAPSLRDSAPQDDGLYLIDLRAGTKKLLFSVSEVVAQRYGDEPNPPQGPFWLTHPTFNTDGTGFCFYLRRQLTDGFLYSDFFFADREGDTAKFLMHGLVSHFDWRDPSHVVVWARESRVLDGFRQGKALENPVILSLFECARATKRAIYGQKKTGAFYLLNVKTGQRQTIGTRVLVEDSHNMLSPDREWMVCDTYTDKKSNRSLFLYQVESEKRIDIGRFPSPPRLDSGGAHCDLHPRWNRSGTQVCVDSAQDETRQIYVADVEEIVAEPEIGAADCTT